MAQPMISDLRRSQPVRDDDDQDPAEDRYRVVGEARSFEPDRLRRLEEDVENG